MKMKLHENHPGSQISARWPTDGPPPFRVTAPQASDTKCMKRNFLVHSIRPATLFRESATCSISDEKIHRRVAPRAHFLVLVLHFQQKETSGISEICHRPCSYHEFCTRQGGRSLPLFAQKLFFSSLTLVDAKSQSTRPY